MQASFDSFELKLRAMPSKTRKQAVADSDNAPTIFEKRKQGMLDRRVFVWPTIVFRAISILLLLSMESCVTNGCDWDPFDDDDRDRFDNDEDADSHSVELCAGTLFESQIGCINTLADNECYLAVRVHRKPFQLRSVDASIQSPFPDANNYPTYGIVPIQFVQILPSDLTPVLIIFCLSSFDPCRLCVPFRISCRLWIISLRCFSAKQRCWVVSGFRMSFFRPQKTQHPAAAAFS